MTPTLIFITLLLVIIAVWQLSKIFKLSKIGLDDSQIANSEDNKIQGYLMFGFLAFIYLLTIYSFWKWGPLVLDEAASEHGVTYDNLMNFTFVLIFIVQIITQTLLHFFAYKYKGKTTNRAYYLTDNNKLEVIWTLVPMIILTIFILRGLVFWSDIMYIDEDEDPLVVEIYGQQFNWKIRYAGNDNVLGDANVRFLQDFEGKNIIGIDHTDPNGKDDVVVTSELHLPKNRKVLFKLRSQDVLHSAYFPHFRAQMNCVPGMVTQFAFTPTVTTEEMRKNPNIMKKVKETNKLRALRIKQGEDIEPWEFDYVLLCNKICGSSHYNMQIKIIVEDKEDFESWISQQPTFGEMISQN